MERKPRGYWNNYENCYNAAKKHKSKSEFIHKCVAAYRNAMQNGWLTDYTWFIETRKSQNYWNNYENCYNEAKKYKTRHEFEKKCSGAYKRAAKNGWLDDYTWFEQKQKPSGYWTYERCYEEAQKYKTLGEFQKKSGSAYVVSRKKGWKKDYTWFVNGRKKSK